MTKQDEIADPNIHPFENIENLKKLQIAKLIEEHEQNQRLITEFTNDHDNYWKLL